MRQYRLPRIIVRAPETLTMVPLSCLNTYPVTKYIDKHGVNSHVQLYSSLLTGAHTLALTLSRLAAPTHDEHSAAARPAALCKTDALVERDRTRVRGRVETTECYRTNLILRCGSEAETTQKSYKRRALRRRGRSLLRVQLFFQLLGSQGCLADLQESWTYRELLSLCMPSL